VTSGGIAGSNPGSSWHLVGAADVNGDGKADILWQNSNGTPAVWFMNGTSLLSGAALPNPGTPWHALAIGT
jgi:serralysin